MPTQKRTRAKPDPRRQEWLKCSLSFPYWLDSYGHIYDATRRRWIRFRLWPGQLAVAEAIAPPATPASAHGDGASPPHLAASPKLLPAETPHAGAMHSPDPGLPAAPGYTLGGMPRAAAGSPRSASPHHARLFIILKARQLGMTWLAVGFALWLMLFRPAATVLLFSKRDDEAVHLLRFRLRGMYQRLPEWMQARAVEADNDHELSLSNGSTALAFPTTGGRSYTATMALVDEADHTARLGQATRARGELDRLLDAVKPTVDAGGWLILLSTADKGEPGSTFKRIYQAAQRGENGYVPIFLPWNARPDRTPEWYAAIRRDYVARDGTSDALYGEYPANDVEALAARQSDRRFAAEWLNRIADCGLPIADWRAPAGGAPGSPRENAFNPPQFPRLPVPGEQSGQWGWGEWKMADGKWQGDGSPDQRPEDATAGERETEAGQATAIGAMPSAISHPLPCVSIFRLPEAGRRYVIGVDPAEGNPQSDESAASVVDADTGEQVAVLAGRLEPAVLAARLADVAGLYNGAGILVERNNHGHAVLLWLAEHKWDWLPVLPMAHGPARPGQATQASPSWPGHTGQGGVDDCPAPYSLLYGWDRKPGWLSSGRGKTLAFDAAADAVREGRTVIRDRITLEQMMAIRGATLSAPAGEHDDRAVAHVLALAALRWCDLGPSGTGASHQVTAPDPIAEADAGGFS
jgi:hypothetical protein